MSCTNWEALAWTQVLVCLWDAAVSMSRNTQLSLRTRLSSTDSATATRFSGCHHRTWLVCPGCAAYAHALGVHSTLTASDFFYSYRRPSSDCRPPFAVSTRCCSASGAAWWSDLLPGRTACPAATSRTEQGGGDRGDGDGTVTRRRRPRSYRVAPSAARTALRDQSRQDGADTRHAETATSRGTCARTVSVAEKRPSRRLAGWSRRVASDLRTTDHWTTTAPQHPWVIDSHRGRFPANNKQNNNSSSSHVTFQ